MTRLFAHALIRFYQLTASAVVGRQCRYLPTCSDYADEAIGRHGLWPGSWMALARVCRCHPWGDSGYDPVPDRSPDGVWHRPWRYGRWRADRSRADRSRADRSRGRHDRASSSAAKP